MSYSITQYGLFRFFSMFLRFIYLLLLLLSLLLVGEKRGFWLIPNAPPNLHEIALLCIFFCSFQQKTKLPTKNTDSSSIASRIPMRSHFCAFFPAKNQQKQNYTPKISFYVCDQAQLFSADFKHTFSSCDRIDFGKIPKISNSF